MKRIFLSLATLAFAAGAFAQCTADFDFGSSLYGASPDASLGEQFDTAYVNVAYSDVFHVLVPLDASAIDPAFQLPLDSIILVNTTLVADSGAGATLSFSDIGLEIQCNNGGISSNPCSFPGGGQYCADLVGTPTMGGIYTMSIEVQAWVSIFGVAVPQPYFFDGYVLTIMGTSSVDEPGELAFDLFPNPANNRVQIDLPAGDIVRNVVVRDLAGRVMHRMNPLDKSRFILDVSAWADGIYFVTLEGDRQQWTERLVVRH